MQTQAIRYSPLAQIFRWVIAALIVVQFTLARLADPLPLGVHKLAILARHKSVGMTILMLAVLRLLWRLRHRAPPLPPGMTRFERMAALHARRVLCAAVRHAAHRLDHVVRQELLRELVRPVHLAEPHR
jgi:cytochrome b561